MAQQIPNIRQDEMTNQDASDYALEKAFLKHIFKVVKKL